jgi:arylsulfatase A
MSVFTKSNKMCRLTFAILTSVVLALAGGQMAIGAAVSPNIVVILCDDLGYGDLQCYGHPVIETPNLNMLAAGGLRFIACYSASPVCSPARVGLLTGRNPNRAGVYDWIRPASGVQPDCEDLVHLRRCEITIPQLLQNAGYATCMAGKWHCNSKFNSADQPQPDAAGFDYWFATQNNAFPSHLNPENYVRNGKSTGRLEGSSCQLAAQEVISWLDRHVTDHPHQPFFVYLAFHEPHEPVASPEELVAKYRTLSNNEDEAQYFANVANVDLAVGRIVRSLERLNRRENTLIIFTSDNGPETLNRYRTATRSYGRATPLRGMKLWTTEGGIRVPGIINWPAKKFGGRVSNEPVFALDFLPTICELASVQPPATLHLDGISIVPLLNGQHMSRPQPLLWCYFNSLNEQQVAMRSGNWKMLAKLDGGRLMKMRNWTVDDRTAVMSRKLTDFELYRLDDDIHESRDVFDTEPYAHELKRQMVRLYKELSKNSYYWNRDSL